MLYAYHLFLVLMSRELLIPRRNDPFRVYQRGTNFSSFQQWTAMLTLIYYFTNTFSKITSVWIIRKSYNYLAKHLICTISYRSQCKRVITRHNIYSAWRALCLLFIPGSNEQKIIDPKEKQPFQSIPKRNKFPILPTMDNYADSDTCDQYIFNNHKCTDYP